MFKRWVIRGVFLGLLLLCVGGWVWSGFFYTAVWSLGIECSTRCGQIYLMGNSIPPPLFLAGNQRVTFDIWRVVFPPPNVGFDVGHTSGQWWVGVPYWFLILVFSLALLYVWRKTRPQLSPATAFPVEITGAKS